MNKWKIYIILLVIIFIVAGAMWYYFTPNPPQNEWDFIPQNAFFIYKKQNTQANADMFSLSDTLLKKITSENNISFLQTISSLRDIPFLISFHHNNEFLFDILMVFPIPDKESKTKISLFLEMLQKTQHVSSHTRRFGSYTIYEIYGGDKKNIFFYSSKNGFFIGSFDSYLVEEALISSEKKEAPLFLPTSHSVSPNNDYIIINPKEVQNIFSHIFFTEEKKTALVQIFEQPIVLEKTKNNTLFTGYTFFEKENYAHFWGFKNNPSVPLTLQKVISQRNISFLIFDFTSAEQWGSQIKEFWKKNAPDIIEKQKELETTYKIHLEDIYREIQQQVAFISFPAHTSEKNPLGFIIEIKNTFFFPNSFDKFKSTDEELYRSYTLKKIDVAELPALLFGEKLRGFPTLYYTYHDTYLLAANNIHTLKIMVEDITQDRTLSNTYSSKNIFQRELSSANVNYFVNIPEMYREMKNKIQEKWKDTFDALFFLLFQNIEMVSFQVDAIQEKSYTVLSLFSQDTVKTEDPTDATDTFQIHFSAPIITAPTPFQNADGTLDFLMQDSTYTLYQISDSYQVMWQDSLDSEVTSPFFEIDPLADGKKQYAFTTHKYIYILEKNGDFVPPFPINVSYDNDIEYFQVIKKDVGYEYVVVDKSGLIFCINTDGKNKQGWIPKKLPYKMSSPPAGVFVKNTLYLVATTITGEVHILNENGMKIQGFPLFLNSTVSNPIQITDGTSTNNIFFTLLTDNGLLVSANLDGKIAYRKNFYRETKKTLFQTIPDKLNNSTLYAKREKENITFLNEQGKVIFDAKLPFSPPIHFSIRYFHFDTDMSFIILENREENISYLIHENTGLFYKYPIHSTTDVEIFPQTNEEYSEYFMIYGRGKDIILQKIHSRDFNKDITKEE